MDSDRACPIGPPMRTSLNIGVVAYECLGGGAVFVRVPNERGRWMLTDRCVVEVDCPTCNAVTGEPCKRWGAYWAAMPASDPRLDRYGVTVHHRRKSAWTAKRVDAGEPKPVRPPKLRLRPEDYDFEVTLKQPLGPVAAEHADG